MQIKLQHVISVIFLSLLIMIPYSHANGAYSDFEATYKLYEMERKEIIFDNLDLTAKEAQKFWPIYNAYRIQINDEVKALIELLQPLTNDISGISNTKAGSIVERAMDLEAKHYKVHKEHILDLKSKSILSGTKLLRYYQLEVGLIAAFKNNFSSVVPLVPIKEDKTK